MKTIGALELRIIKRMIIVSLIISLLFLLLDNSMIYIFGLLFGTLMAILKFVLLKKNLINASNMSSAKAEGYITKQYFLRYLLTGFILYAAVKSPYMHVLGTALGLIIIKFVIMYDQLFDDLSFFKKIFTKYQ